MNKTGVLSSEKALDDYFTDLLSDEFDELYTEYSPEIKLQPQVQHAVKTTLSYADAKPKEVDAPNLNDVERLLSQLESVNSVVDSEVKEIIARNTVDIAPVAEAEADVVSAVAEEEIQEWDIGPHPDVVSDIATETLVAESVVAEQESVAQLAMPEPEVAPEVEIDNVAVQDVEQQVESDSGLQTQSGGFASQAWQSTERNEDFQVLYFDVNGVTFAVPLDELGGIHQLGDLSHLIGRPGWYLGLQTNRENQLDVVDTAKWVMADKLKDDDYKAHYQYIVMLDESMWGLASTKLLGTELLNTEKVRWRTQAGKRPWLAGMVKEKMCALIHVKALIGMLNAGLDVSALNRDNKSGTTCDMNED